MTVATLKNKGRPVEILLVEDNRGDVVLMSRAFREANIGCTIVSATDAEKALAILRKEGEFANSATPDIILLDLNLPGMNGHEFLKIIKSDDKLQRIPVVVLSSSRADRDVALSYDLRANGHVVKPLVFEKMKEFVASIEQFFFTLITIPDATDYEKIL